MKFSYVLHYALKYPLFIVYDNSLYLGLHILPWQGDSMGIDYYPLEEICNIYLE